MDGAVRRRRRRWRSLGGSTRFAGRARGRGDRGVAAALYAFPVDRWVLPDTTRRLFARGKQVDVPILVGWNGNEAAGDGGFRSRARRRCRVRGSRRGRVRRRCGALHRALSTGRRSRCRVPARPRRRDLRLEHAGVGARDGDGAIAGVLLPLRARVLRRRPAPWPGMAPSWPTCSATSSAAKGRGEADRERSRLMMSYWVAFATTGDPNARVDRHAGGAGVEHPRWERYTADRPDDGVRRDRGAPLRRARHRAPVLRRLLEAAGAQLGRWFLERPCFSSTGTISSGSK